MNDESRFLGEYSKDDVDTLRELATVDREIGLDERADLLERVADDVEECVESDEVREFVAKARENSES